MIRAVIFDMDGVIADTEKAIAQASIQMFRQLYGLEVKRNDFSPFVGTGAKNYIKGAAAKYGVKVNIREAMKRREENFAKLALSGGVSRFPGVTERINEAKTLGLKTAIATSSHKTKLEVTLRGVGIGKEEFDVITTAEECNNVKPAPEIFLLTAKKLNVLPKDIIIVEDSPAGIKAAKTGGFLVVGVASTFSKDKLQKADFVVENLKELSLKNLINVPSG